jgi:hypothetical protein
MIAAFDHGIVAVDGTEDTVRVVGLSWDERIDTILNVADGPWAEFGGSLAKREAYGHRALLSMVAGEVATSQAEGFEVYWWSARRSPSYTKIVREWRRAPARGDTPPTVAQLESLGRTRDVVEKIVAGQQYGTLKHSVDRLALVGPGVLFVKPVTEAYVYHPYYYGRLPELAPSHWLWEVYHPDGNLVEQLYIASAFVPHLIDGCFLYGVQTSSDGLQEVASIDLGAICDGIVTI